ncbi:hypothetical protein F1D05_25280 [Kribbella qitaiheensis]|uniref:Uncharacterized protein n=1 Tax=Kribbella qitaiheensis TaxID=1544730 RepID=A0A7G6X302_9ACTN|nr:hypothetical protein [Kribbella qitaiheensis]QNE20617.1 hypothetical protein F1D05_25280 [Kribbella qitaiheensis]
MFDPADPIIEARTNTWSLATDDGERTALSVAEVIGAFEDCASALRSRWRMKAAEIRLEHRTGTSDRK